MHRPRRTCLRFTVGRASCPDLSFAAPDCPAWRNDDSLSCGATAPHLHSATARKSSCPGRRRRRRSRLQIDVGNARILGFGAATPGPERNGRRFRVMTRDTLLFGIEGASYTALPFFVARDAQRTLGFLVATTYPLDVDVSGRRVAMAAPCATDDAPVDVIVFRGTLAEIVRDLSSVVGRTFLPPAWSLGFHQSRWSYRTQDEVVAVARRFRDLDLPADVIHLDIHYMDRYRVFTFSPRRFPDPARMHASLGEMGMRTLAIVDPGVSAVDYPVHEMLRSGDMLLTRSDGTRLRGPCLAGRDGLPGLFRCRASERPGAASTHRCSMQASRGSGTT